jgi:hypothetical protein
VLPSQISIMRQPGGHELEYCKCSEQTISSHRPLSQHTLIDGSGKKGQYSEPPHEQDFRHCDYLFQRTLTAIKLCIHTPFSLANLWATRIFWDAVQLHRRNSKYTI